MKTGKELKPGTVIRLENDPWLVQKAEFIPWVFPGEEDAKERPY